jgi:hypothetical protein
MAINPVARTEMMEVARAERFETYELTAALRLSLDLSKYSQNKHYYFWHLHLRRRYMLPVVK